MTVLRPSQLPPGSSANPAGSIPIDQGSTVEKVTPKQVVDSGRPLATQVAAETGASNDDLMSSLRVSQAIDAQAVALSTLAATTGADMIGAADGASGAKWSTVAGYIAYLKSTAGAGEVGWKIDADGIATTVAIALAERRTATQYGAKGDAVLTGHTLTGTDDTAALQKAIDKLPKGAVLDGLGRTYRVVMLFLKSNMLMTNFRFIADGNNINSASVIQIGTDRQTANGYHDSTAGTAAYNTSRTAPGHTDIVLNNIHIHGNRHNQTDLVGFGADGGRQGFSIIGYCRNITVMNSSATYCATDGFQVYHGNSLPGWGVNNLSAHNIKVINCEFTWNRRHGGSGDSIDGFLSVNTKWNDNGLAVDGGTTQGDEGAVFSGGPYGNGFDMEGYAMGSRVTNITFQGGEALRNARGGILFLDPTLQTEVGYVPSDNILIDSVELDMGLLQTAPYCLYFTSPSANAALGPVYTNVRVRGGLHKGQYDLRAVDGLTIIGLEQNIPATIPGSGAATSANRLNTDNATNIYWMASKSNKTNIPVGPNSTVFRDDGVFTHSELWEPGLVAAGTSVTKTVSIPGANYTNSIAVASHTGIRGSASLGELIVYANVIGSTGSTLITIRNPTTGDLTVLSGNVNVRVMPWNMI